MRPFVIASMFLLISNLVYCQSTKLTLDILELINQSRTNPEKFLADNSLEIKKHQPKYINILGNAKPIPAVLWDKGLEEMAKSVVDSNNLNPIYKGVNEICGRSGGSRSGTLSKTPIEYVCDIYTNINDRSYKFIGIYFNKQKNNGYSFQWGKACDREKVEFFFNEKIDSSSVDLKILNTAAKADYMTEQEKRMVFEINFVRKHPRIYSKIISKYLSEKSNSKGGLNYDTYKAGLELIDELDTMESLNVLIPKKCIYDAAKIHGLDCKGRGFFSHTGSDKSDPWDRITKQCSDFKTGNENASAGSGNSRDRVISLLLDDGISSRGHRYNIINKKWVYVGCFRYEDPKYGYYWVQNFGY
ncbi:hypothetical protein JYT74_02935 [Crocinitomix catalasitica]|nr:hypothetical protein [Crocinitomix catalasitica]